jgi:putative aldouronate transport system substrate-binding protein
MNFYDRGLDLLRQVDGQIWGLPAINPCFHCMHAQRMWVNEDWRNTLGIPVPTTIDEFYNMLVAFRDMDPNGNGVGDEIPLSGAMNGWHTQSHFFLMQSFLPFDNIQQGFMIDENENVVNRVTDLRFRDGLRFINRLHEEGLMYAGTLIQDNDVLRMQMMNPDIDIVGAAAAGFHGVLGEIGTERMRKYMPIRPLIGPGGQNAWSSLQEPIDNRLVITTTAPDPGLIARWANYFYTYEVTGALYNGLEGVGWRWAEPGEVGFDGHQAMWFALMPYFAGMGGQRNDVWTQLGIFNYSFDWRVGQAVDPDVDLWSPEGLENVLHIVTEQYMEPFNWNNLILPRINLSADEFNVIGTVRTEWNTFFDEAVFNFVTGVWNLDSDWYSFVDNVYGIYRMNEMLAVYQTAFDRAYRR